MRRALAYAGDFDALVVHHTEDPDLIGDGVMNEGEFAARLGLFGIPKAAETIVLERDLRLVALSEARYHAASISCAESLDVLRRAKDAGLAVTAAASVNHLALNEIDIGSYRTFFKVAPPLRAEDDRLALVQALGEGLLDVVMSDHNPQDVETKRLPFAEAAPGAIKCETRITVRPPAARPRTISWNRWTSVGRERGRRLVEHDQLGVAGERPQDLDLLLLGQRERPDDRVRRAPSKPVSGDEALERARAACAAARSRAAGARGSEEHVLCGGERPGRARPPGRRARSPWVSASRGDRDSSGRPAQGRGRPGPGGRRPR